MIYFTSDLHFCHDKPFLYEPRGFSNIEDHDQTIVKNWNNIVKDDDTVYLLGDLMLMDNEKGMQYVKQLKGKIHIIIGNHDTPARQLLYKTLPNVVEICYATMLKYKDHMLYLSHYPTLVGTETPGNDAPKKFIYNLFGHTHQTTNFYKDVFYMYHVGLDSHSNCVVSIDQVIQDCQAKLYSEQKQH